VKTQDALWITLGLLVVGFLLLWWGSHNTTAVLWLGMAIFTAGMLIAPLTRVFTTDEEDDS
jgi:hypothetical protein